MKALLDLTFTERNLIYVFVLAALIILILVIISYGVFNSNNRKHLRKIKSKSNTANIFVIDAANDCVSYFNLSALEKKTTTSMTDFYNIFSSEDRDKLISWINDLLNDVEGTKNYIEVSRYVRRQKKNLINILQVQKVEYKKSLIYLDSHILNYSTKRVHTNEIAAFSNMELFSNTFYLQKGRGSSFCINFFDKKTKVNGLSHLSYVEIKNIISKFKKENILMYALDSNKFVICDFEIDNKVDSLTFIEEVKNKINSYLLIESLIDDISFSVGSAENRYFRNNVSGLIRSISKLADFAKDNEQLIMFFDENNKNIEETSFKTQIETVISENKLQYFYQPVFDVGHYRMFGYLSNVDLENNLFKNFEEFKNFAIRTDEDKKLFSSILSHSIMNFVEEKALNYTKLFMPVSLNEVQYIDKLIAKIPDVKEANLIILLNESDVVKIADDAESMDNLADKIRGFKSKGFEVALKIDDEILNLASNFYSLFDYFVIPADSFSENLTKRIPVFKGLIEQLLKYKKQIVAININSWDMFELVYKFGINILCGDCLANKNENILPLDKKVLTKIKKIKA